MNKVLADARLTAKYVARAKRTVDMLNTVVLLEFHSFSHFQISSFPVSILPVPPFRPTRLVPSLFPDPHVRPPEAHVRVWERLPPAPAPFYPVTSRTLFRSPGPGKRSRVTIARAEGLGTRLGLTYDVIRSRCARACSKVGAGIPERGGFPNGLTY